MDSSRLAEADRHRIQQFIVSMELQARSIAKTLEATFKETEPPVIRAQETLAAIQRLQWALDRERTAARD